MRNLVLTVDGAVDEEVLGVATDFYRPRLGPDLQLIISSIGPLVHKECVKAPHLLVESPERPKFNLAEARNQAYRIPTGFQFIFCDIDTQIDIALVPFNMPIIRGVKRRDVAGLFDGKKYRCACSPMAIYRQTLADLGGYCEEFSGWGYEDSDFERKWPELAYDIDAEARHIVWMHDRVTAKPGWNRASEQNRELFMSRRNLTVEQIIAKDNIAFREKYL